MSDNDNKVTFGVTSKASRP